MRKNWHRIFCKVMDKNRQSINPQKPFNAYIYTIARNTAFNYIKHKSVEEAFLKNCNHLKRGGLF